MNLIFIGMPGSGKTELSRRAAAALGRPWLDSDLELERRAGRSIPDIFAQDGETVFRRMESACIAALLKRSGKDGNTPENLVLAVGGGAVEHNETLLRGGGFVVYIRRDIEKIARTLDNTTGTRPLLDGNALTRLRILHERRKPLYERCCHTAVDNNGTLEETLRILMEVYHENFSHERSQSESVGFPGTGGVRHRHI